MTMGVAHRGSGSVRVKMEQRAELFPMHRADVVAAIEPLTPSILDFLAEPVHRFRVARYSIIRVVSAQLLIERLLLFRERQVTIVVALPVDAAHGSGETVRRCFQLDHPVTLQGDSPVMSETK